MFKIGRVTVTRHNSYNQLKHYISNQILLSDDRYLPSIRDLEEVLGVARSSVSRAILLLSEQDNWLVKIQQGNSPRNTIYKIIATPDQAEAYKNYYLLPTRKKVKFRKMLKDAGQLEKQGQKSYWAYGMREWANEFNTASSG
jgi:DNA-binding transcriptional MocR family regulator